MQELTYFNGEFVPNQVLKLLGIDDRGYLFGDSPYEVVAVSSGPFVSLCLTTKIACIALCVKWTSL